MKLEWYRYPEPVIPVDPAKPWKALHTANPDIMVADGQVRMYYRGTSSALDQGFQKRQVHVSTIGLAVLPEGSPDAFTWEDYPQNPVVKVGEREPFDNIIDPSIVYFRHCRPYLLFTSAWKDGQTPGFIGLSESLDGKRFINLGHAFEGRAPEVLVKGGKLYLFYVSDEDAASGKIPRRYVIRLAIGEEKEGRFNFQEHPESPVLVAEGWEGNSVTTPRIFCEGNYAYMVYAADPIFWDYPPYFGLARSPLSGLIGWERWEGNPFFTIGPEGSGDQGAIWYGDLFKFKGHYYLFYEGYDGNPHPEKPFEDVDQGKRSQIFGARLENVKKLSDLFS